MAKINLLPWRENLRQERQRNFFVMMAVAAAAAVVLVLLANVFMNRQISAQEARNQFLQNEIRQLDREIRQIEELERVRDNLLARKEVIERLQEHRSMTVHLFNYLAQTVPDGIRLTSVGQAGENLTIEGRTQSETRVSEYMRNIEDADWLHRPRLRIITRADGGGPDMPFRFEVNARIAAPAAVDQED